MNNSNSTPLQMQHEHQQKLREMYRQNYREDNPEELRNALFDYLIFLDSTVTGKDWGLFVRDEFSIPELEVLVRYQESVLRSKLAKNRLQEAVQ